MKDREIELDTAILAWQKGFNKRNYITQSLLQKWLREKHNLHIHLYFIDHVLGYNCVITNIKTNIELFETKPFKIYEEALEEGLQKTCKEIKLI